MRNRARFSGLPRRRLPGTGAEPPFVPSDLPNLVYFLQAGPTWCFTDIGGTVPAGDAGLVRVWADQGGGNQMNQATEGLRPILRAVSGGRWEVEFDGTDDHMQNNGFAVSQPMTCYIRVNSHTGGGYFFYSLNSVVAFGWNVALGSDYSIYAGAGGASFAMARIGATPGTFTGVVNGVSSALYLDGNVLASGDAGANDLGAGIRVGEFAGGGSGNIAAKIVAILIYTGAHDADTRALVEGYLGTL